MRSGACTPWFEGKVSPTCLPGCTVAAEDVRRSPRALRRFAILKDPMSKHLDSGNSASEPLQATDLVGTWVDLRRA